MISPTVARARTASPIASMRLRDGITGVVAHAGERGLDGIRRAASTHIGKTLESAGPRPPGRCAASAADLLVALRVGVDPDHDPPAGAHLALEHVGGVGDLALEVTFVDPGVDPFEDRALAELVEIGEDGFGLPFELVGQPLDEPRAPERIGDVGDARLVQRSPAGCASAMRAALSVGRASTSSIEFVCRLWVPPRTPARASIAVRTMFTSGCWAVSETPAVWVWKRSWVERGAGRRTARASTAPRYGVPPGTSRSPRRSRCAR